MARFFVGQRVKVKWFRYWVSEPATEGLIRDIGRWDAGSQHEGLRLYFFEPAEAIVDLASGEIGAFLLEQLEPIIPDGHRAGVKGECSLLDELLSREVKNETVK